MWKALICMLGCRKNDYVKSIRIGNDLYVITISKYRPVTDLIAEMKKALDAATPKAK